MPVVSRAALAWPGVLIAVLLWAAPSRAARSGPVGWWTFSGPAPLHDRTGNWAPLALGGTARVADGALHLAAVADDWYRSRALGWALASGYTGPTITDKTLVVWVRLHDPAIRGGGVFSLDTADDSDVFDGIRWAELAPRRWTASSNFWARSQQAIRVDEESDGVVQLARVDDARGDDVTVTFCRNGHRLMQYDDAPAATFHTGNAEVVFGKGHTSRTYPETGGLAGEIHEARLYDLPLDCASVGALSLTP